MSKNLNLQSLLEFYDYRPPKSKGHASAINAVLGENIAIELMKHYFKGEGYEVTSVQPCTQGARRGHRLDIWFGLEKGDNKTIHQVEIKNWSAHSLGGIQVDKDWDQHRMEQHRKMVWGRRFNIENKVPAEIASEKVLTQMMIPDEYRQYKQHKALLCFWEPMHPEGKLIPLFEVPVISEAFNTLSVFSMSNYVSILLRQKIATLEVCMEEADARVDWLQQLYS